MGITAFSYFGHIALHYALSVSLNYSCFVASIVDRKRFEVKAYLDRVACLKKSKLRLWYDSFSVRNGHWIIAVSVRYAPQ